MTALGHDEQNTRIAGLGGRAAQNLSLPGPLPTGEGLGEGASVRPSVSTASLVVLCRRGVTDFVVCGLPPANPTTQD